MRHRLLISARSIVLGWAMLCVLTILVERPLLRWTLALLGAAWLPTVQLALECAALVGTGWIIGRWCHLDGVRTVSVFAMILAVWNFGLVPAMNVAWLFQLIVDSFGDARYLESLITTAVTHALLFGSLLVGASLNRERQPASSLGLG